MLACAQHAASLGLVKCSSYNARCSLRFPEKVCSYACLDNVATLHESVAVSDNQLSTKGLRASPPTGAMGHLPTANGARQHGR